MTVNGLPCRLEPYAPRPLQARGSGKEASADSLSVSTEHEIGNRRAGEIAYSLLRELYLRFGFEADRVPLVDYQVTPPAVDPRFITGERQER